MILLSQPMIMKPVESIKTPPIPPKKHHFFLSRTLILLETHSMSLSKLWEMVKDREAWHEDREAWYAAVHGAAESQTRLSD